MTANVPAANRAHGIALPVAFWLIFLPSAIALRLAWLAIAKARREEWINVAQMLSLEHFLFYLTPALLLVGAFIVWRAPEHGEKKYWRVSARVVSAAIAILGSVPFLIVMVLTLLGWKDS